MRAETKLAYGLLLLSLLLLCLLELYPIPYSVWLTVQEISVDISGIDTEHVGLDHWRQMLTDPALPPIVWTTLYFTTVVVVSTLVVGLGVALLPWAIPAVVSGRIWGLIWSDPTAAGVRALQWLRDMWAAGVVFPESLRTFGGGANNMAARAQ